MDPQSLKFTETHEWVSLDGDIATVGISKFAVEQLTDLLLVELPPVGKTVTAGKTFGEVESVKAVSDLYAPVDGEVIEVNPAVTRDVSVLADDPFDKGWLVKIRVADPKAALASLMDYASYQRKVADSSH
jgi:glycine cleavage system H protein